MELPLASWSAVLLLFCLAACGGDSTCSPPATPEHGEMFVVWPGLLVQFRCFDGYKLIGPSAVICRNGTWTQDAPLCKPVVETGSAKIAMQGDEATSRREDQAQLQGASQPLLTVIAVPEEDPGRIQTDSRNSSSPRKPDSKKTGGKKNKNNNGDKKEGKKKNNKKGEKKVNNNNKDKKNKKNDKTEQEKTDKKKGRRAKTSSSSGSGVIETEQRNVNQVESDTTDTSADNFPVDLATLDQSCLSEQSADNPISPAPLVPHSTPVKYARRRNKSPPNNRYAVALYQCTEGFSFVVPDADRLYCRQGRWIGPSPICVSDAPSNAIPEAVEISAVSNTSSSSSSGSSGSPSSNVCGDNKGGCEHICEDATGIVNCLCYRGYVLADDGLTCLDVDECLVDNGGCEGLCVNKQGSYQCFCSAGFRLASNGKKCIDHNECLLRNGHGPCQGSCRNTHGSYECSCDELPGTQLAADRHSCEDIDECKGDNFGCSHDCINTLGTAFCSCPDGLMLGEDWKTCEDIDECDLEDVGQTCVGECVNTIGSYYCSDSPKNTPQNVAVQNITEIYEETQNRIDDPSTSVPDEECKSGFHRTDSGPCTDIDECLINNYGCSHLCNNTDGSAHCYCRNGFQLASDGKTCQDIDECSLNNNGCSDVCVNTQGSAYCECPQGFELSADNKTCEDVNECEENNYGCSMFLRKTGVRRPWLT